MQYCVPTKQNSVMSHHHLFVGYNNQILYVSECVEETSSPTIIPFKVKSTTE